MIARSDGASAGFGFSTMSSTSYTPSAIRFPRMIPYRETASFGTRWIARTTPALYFSYAVDHLLQHGDLGVDHVVREDDGERLLADEVHRPEHRVARAPAGGSGGRRRNRPRR